MTTGANKIKSLKICLNRPNAVVFSGESISGTVTIECEEAVRCQEVRLRIFGYAWVRPFAADGAHASQDAGTSKAFHAEERYIDHNIPFIPSAKADSQWAELSEGVTTYDWDYTLPEHLPSSFESPGRRGGVRYYVSCNVAPWFPDRKTKKFFTVLGYSTGERGPNNLSTPQSAQTPPPSVLTRLLGGKEPTGCQVEINKRAFVPGEHMVINAQVENNTGKSTERTRAALLQTITYRGKSKPKKTSHAGSLGILREERLVCELYKGSIAPGQCQTWVTERLRVPSVPATDLASGACRIMGVAYKLEFIVDSVVLLTFPILIESITETEASADGLQSAAAGRSVPHLGIEDQPPTYEMTSSELPQTPPPAYEDCVFGSAEDSTQEDGVEVPFTPKYLCLTTPHTSAK